MSLNIRLLSLDTVSSSLTLAKLQTAVRSMSMSFILSTSCQRPVRMNPATACSVLSLRVAHSHEGSPVDVIYLDFQKAFDNTPFTWRSVNAVTPPRPKQTDCSVTFIILCVAVIRHDFCVTPSRLIEETAARPSYDSPTNCVTGPRRAHDRHGIIILIHDRRTTPSRRFQDLCVTLLGYIKR